LGTPGIQIGTGGVEAEAQIQMLRSIAAFLCGQASNRVAGQFGIEGRVKPGISPVNSASLAQTEKLRTDDFHRRPQLEVF
jgi:hypothetical protein